MSEEGGFSNRASHDPFDHGHMTHGPPHTDKTSGNEMAALGGAVLDGPICMLPQLGDSEEKLRQVHGVKQTNMIICISAHLTDRSFLLSFSGNFKSHH